MDCSSRHAQVFAGSLTSVAVDALSFNRVLSSPSDIYRTHAAITRGQQHPFYLITHLHSAWHVRQRAYAAYLRPGDAVLIDSARRYELHCPESVTVMSVQLPRQWVGQWLSQVECAAPRAVLRDQGWSGAANAKYGSGWPHFVREFQATHAVTPARWRKQAGMAYGRFDGASCAAFAHHGAHRALPYLNRQPTR